MTSTRVPVFIVAAALGAALAGCGGSAPRPVAPAARIEHTRTGSTIILSSIGAQRIGIQTAPATTVPAQRRAPAQGSGSVAPARTASSSGPVAIIPFSAVVYDPSGQALAFTSPAPFTYAEVPITVEKVTGDSAYLRKGPPPGTRVVTVGAEELLGVQAGVQAQT